MNEEKEWATYVARVNTVEAVKAIGKSFGNSTSVLDAAAGDMIQCVAKS